jgi:hypothetical protein
MDSIEDIAKNGAGTLDPDVLPGASEQLTLLAGGAAPTTATLNLKGSAIPVDGEFAKGDAVVLRIVARVGEIHFKDRLDKYGVLHTDRKHVLVVERVEQT